jgi:septum formation protein
MSSFWSAPHPLVLASQSAARRSLLASTGIPFETQAAEVDERAIEAELLGAAPEAIAARLARAKAMAVSALRPDRLVVGADQVLAQGDRLFHKPETRADATRQLAALSGRAHELHAAICVVQGGAVLFEAVPIARLTCRTLSEAFIAHYLEAAGDVVLRSVGAYQAEALGIHLFERIEGDHATILGLPLLPLLAFFRAGGFLVG